MTIRRLLFGIALCCPALSAVGQQAGTRVLQIEFRNGKPVKKIAIKDINRIDFSDNVFIVREKNGASMPAVSYVDVLKWTYPYVDVPAGIGNVSEPDTQPVRISGDYVFISGKDHDGQTLRVYNVMGALVCEETYPASSGFYTGGLKSGIYIININNKSIKFIKK